MQEAILIEQARALRKEAETLDRCGALQEAARAYELSLSTFSHAGKACQAETAGLLQKLSSLQRGQGDLPAAQSSLEQAVGLYRNMGASYNSKTAETLYQMGSLQQEQGAYEEALQYYEETLSALDTLPPTETASMKVKALKQMGSLYFENKQFAPALRCFESAVGLAGEYLPPTAPMRLETAAIATLAAAIRMRQSAEGQEAPAGHSAAQFIALAERQLGSLNEAGPLAEQWREKISSLKGALKEMM